MIFGGLVFVGDNTLVGVGWWKQPSDTGGAFFWTLKKVGDFRWTGVCW